jgi:hypothetical protein
MAQHVQHQQDQVEVFTSRFDHALSRLRTFTTSSPALREIYDELTRLRRDMAGLPHLDLAPPAEPMTHRGRAAGSLRVLRTANGIRHADKERDGKRHCPKHDDGAGAWLARDRFGIKNQATGQLKSWCIDCTKAYQRERYVRVGARVVTVELIDGDFLIGHRCPRCEETFEVGQHVQGDDLHHEGCRPKG